MSGVPRNLWLSTPPQKSELGDPVWLRVHRKPGDSKLGRLWVGPAEILQRLSAGQYRIVGPYGKQEVEALRLKP